MMGVDWRGLTLYQYQALLSEWNDRHSDGKPPPDPEKIARVRRAMHATMH